MILSDIGIRQALRSGRLGITPTPLVLQPASVDLTLSGSILVPANRRAGTGNLSHTLPPEGILLRPQSFILGCTEQILSIPSDLAARFEGKSTLGRMGLLTHISAGFVDPGFQGQLTLELANLSPDDILIYPGMQIGQLCFYTLDQPCMHPYGSPQVGSHYQGQAGATAARGDD